MRAVRQAIMVSTASSTRASSRPSRSASAAAAPPAPAPTLAPPGEAEASLPLSYESRVWESHPSALLCGVDEAGRGPLAGPVVAAACIVLHPSHSSAAIPSGVRDSKAVSEEEREALFPALLACPRLVFGVSVLDHSAIDRVNILAASMLAMERATAAARAAACARLRLPTHPSPAGLPKEDRIDFAAAGVQQPPEAPVRPTGIHPLGAIHHIFVDGPHCPPRLASATEGDAYNLSAAASSSSSAAKKKRARGAEGGLGEGAAVQPGRKPPTVVDPPLDALLPERLGPIHTAQPVIKGDSKVFCIAAASLVAKVTRDRLMREYGAQWPAYGFEDHKGYGTSSHMAAIAKHGACPIHRLTFAPLKHMYPQPKAGGEEESGDKAVGSKKAKRAKK